MLKILLVKTVDGEALSHLDHPLGIDTTLCGLSLDGDPLITKSIERKPGFVSCSQCLAIVKFCKSLKDLS